jgi:hypothetical protein
MRGGPRVCPGMSVVLRLVSPSHPAAAPLLAALRQEYADLYGSDVATELDRYPPIEFLPPSGAFLILEDDGMTAAGGALRRLGGGASEIKRMWTAPRFRGRGYARLVLAELERPRCAAATTPCGSGPACTSPRRSGSTPRAVTSGSPTTARTAPTRAASRSRSG